MRRKGEEKVKARGAGGRGGGDRSQPRLSITMYHATPAATKTRQAWLPVCCRSECAGCVAAISLSSRTFKHNLTSQ